MPRDRLPDQDFNWTPELAYVIGLITTDGNLARNRTEIEFSSKDKELVEIFRKCLNLRNKIGRKRNRNGGNYYRLQFNNAVFYRWLQRIGLCPRKTGKLNEIKIPDEYFRDFLRGHLDGDGCITLYKDYWNTFKNSKYVYLRLWVRFISVSEKHIYWLRKRINQLLNVKGHVWRVIPKRNRKATIWSLRFGKRESIKLLSWIYYRSDLPCLERKRKIWKNFLNLHNINKEK